MSWSFTIGRIAGTLIRVHVTFVLFLVWIFAANYVSGGPEAAWHALVFMLLAVPVMMSCRTFASDVFESATASCLVSTPVRMRLIPAIETLLGNVAEPFSP